MRAPPPPRRLNGRNRALAWHRQRNGQRNPFCGLTRRQSRSGPEGSGAEWVLRPASSKATRQTMYWTIASFGHELIEFVGLQLVGTLRDLNPPAILDHRIFFILIGIAVVLVLGAGAICYCTFTKRNNLLEDKLAEEHQKYMKLARGENPEN